jgi:hypothetical protein
VSLDSSKEVMASAVGVSGLLYLASFCALGYALYKLCRKNTPTANRSLDNKQESKIFKPSPDQLHREALLLTIMDAIPSLPKELATLIVDYDPGKREAFQILTEALRPQNKNITAIGMTFSPFMFQFPYAFKTLEAFANGNEASFTIREIEQSTGLFGARDPQWSEEQWIEHLFFGKHKWASSNSQTLLSYIKSTPCLSEFFPQFKVALEQFTADTGLGTVKSDTSASLWLYKS